MQQHRVFALPAPQTVHGYIDLGVVGCGVIPFPLADVAQL